MTYLRKVSLVAYGNPPTPGGTGNAVPNAPATGNTTSSSPDAQQQPQNDQPGIELGNLRIHFEVSAMDVDVPPTAIIRVLNLTDSTAQKIQKEFQSVTLQAGYEDGNFGVIFQGTIIRIRKGRMNNIDSFVEIMASNLDAIYNFGLVNGTLDKSKTGFQNQLDFVKQQVNNSQVAQGKAGSLVQGIQYGNVPGSSGDNAIKLPGGVLPRGKVMFGLARDKLGNIADSNGCVWSIGPDGKINFHTLTGYLPGEAVVINAQTGMIGVPVATQQGIEVNCLLNPLIKIGTLIKLNNSDITTTNNAYQGAGFPAYSDVQFFANTSTDGTYMALVVEHEGDNRGHGGDWLTKIVALAVDSSASSGNASGQGQVAAYG